MNLFSNPFSCFSKKSKVAADEEVAKGKKISLSKKKGTDGGEGSGSKEIMEKFEGFKRFDSAEDYSDHYYRKKNSPANYSLSKDRTKRIVKEWKSLENDLPEKIYVRVYESKIDIMRAAIIGAQGTPYQSGVFFFDIFFPENYPNVPPLVYYRSRGLWINPNLYPNGRVCLSILNTWPGRGKEKWQPGESTILQVLVSIQGLVLNTKPFYNEPPLPWWLPFMRRGEKGSMRYNENVFFLCLKTMVYTIRAPPKNFEDLVMGHFYKHGSHIMATCEAYRNGTHVGSEGSTAPNLDGVIKMKCSKRFRRILGYQMKTLREVFAEVGLQTSL